VINKLDAVKVWDKSTGFTNADIIWDFEVIKGHATAIPMTTLVTDGPLPSKAQSISTNAPSTTTLTGPSRWSSVASHPIKIVATAMLIAASATFGVIHQTRIVPLQEELHRVEKQVQTLRAEVQALQDYKPANPEP
jgi:hypothetical protein